MSVPSACCRYCGSQNCKIDYRLDWRDERFAHYDIVTCHSCNITFTDPFPNPSTLQALYDSAQYQDVDRGGGDPRGKDADEVQRLVDAESFFFNRYRRRFPEPGIVLDVGAGWGLLLKQFQQNGWSPYGIELSSIESEFAREHLRLDVRQCEAEQIGTLQFPKMDLVILRHTLEHFRDPKLVLQELWKTIADRGVVVIEVPDYQSYDRRTYGEAWPGFGPWHLWYFGQSSLERILTDTGFRPLKFERFMSDRIFGRSSNPAHRVLRKILNRCGGPRWFSGRSISVVATKMDHGERDSSGGVNI